jgi:hypothetical protein
MGALAGLMHCETCDSRMHSKRIIAKQKSGKEVSYH